jgi:hypothetical protein
MIGVVGQAFALTSDWSGRIPRFGSTTFSASYVTTSEFRDINLRATTNPYTFDVKPVLCNGGNLSNYKRVEANDHNVRVIASDVRDGTCFKLNFDAPTNNYFDVRGRLSY